MPATTVKASQSKAPAPAQESARHAEPARPTGARPLWDGLSLRARPGLRLDAPGDAREREADQVASQVVDMDDAPSRPVTVTGGVGQDSHATADEQLAPLGTGSALEPPVRAFFEPRFGRDFGVVRVHADAPAARSAESLGAAAYAAGSHLVFGAGQFQPDAPAGRHLIAHELAHVVQQEQAGARTVQRAPAPPVATPRGAHAGPRFDGLESRLREILQIVPDGFDPKVLGELRELNGRVKTVKENFRKGLLPAAEVEYFADKNAERLERYLAGDPSSWR